MKLPIPYTLLCASLIVLYSFVWSWIFDHGLRRCSLPRIPDSVRTNDIWKTASTTRPMQRSYGWNKGKELYVEFFFLLAFFDFYLCFALGDSLSIVYSSRGSYKRMVGSRDGFRERAKMDPFGTSEDIGKQGRKTNGMIVQIYLGNWIRRVWRIRRTIIRIQVSIFLS